LKHLFDAAIWLREENIIPPEVAIHVLFPTMHHYAITEQFTVEQSAGKIEFFGDLSRFGTPFVTLNANSSIGQTNIVEAAIHLNFVEFLEPTELTRFGSTLRFLRRYFWFVSGPIGRVLAPLYRRTMGFAISYPHVTGILTGVSLYKMFWYSYNPSIEPH
jgi:hypothetical protein